jgi:hypothetical protein
MLPSTNGGPAVETRALDAAFDLRLEQALRAADTARRRRHVQRRVQRLLPLILLIGPIVAWRLIVVSPGTVHVAIGALASLTFLLDVGVHVDTSVLSFLGLQALPTIVGGLLLVLVAVTLLSGSEEKLS